MRTLKNALTVNKLFKKLDNAYAKGVLLISIIGTISYATIEVYELKQEIDLIQPIVEEMQDITGTLQDLKHDIAHTDELHLETVIVYEELQRLETRLNMTVETLRRDSADLDYVYEELYLLREDINLILAQ